MPRRAASVIRGSKRVGVESEDWFRVVDRAIELVGEDHVAPGSDFDGGPTLPKPMRERASQSKWWARQDSNL